MRVIRINLTEEGVATARLKWSNPEDSLDDTQISSPPVAFVVEPETMHTLRDLKDLVVDCGRKHASVPLSKKLLGKDKIPAIEGDFNNWYRARSSIKTLLKNSKMRDYRGCFVIGVPGMIFDQLWVKAEPEKMIGEKTTDGPSHEYMPADILGGYLRRWDEPDELKERYLGSSAGAQSVRQFILRAARQADPVLILGDTGTGKEIVARAIHDFSERGTGRFAPVNCSAIPVDMLESELFGHKKGAFTGAYIDKTGFWKMANGGTLFLDEIGDLSPEHQAKILRALQENEIKPVGSTTTIQVDARVIAATNRDLFSMVQSGQFREDLYYRLRKFLIYTPSLKEYPEDTELMVREFWERLTPVGTPDLSSDVLAALQTYSWPGNVRELKAVLSNVFALFENEKLTAGHIRALFRLVGQQAVSQDVSTEEGLTLHRMECLRHLRRVDEVVRACKVSVRRVVYEGQRDEASVQALKALTDRHLDELEVLCRHPLLFHSEVMFSLVHKLKGMWSYFGRLVSGDLKAALQFWKRELQAHLQLVISSTFREVEHILRHDEG